MHRSIFKSFRFEIVLYGLFSLICTLLAEGSILGIGYLIVYALRSDSLGPPLSTVYNNTVDTNENAGTANPNTLYFSIREKIATPVPEESNKGIFTVIVIAAIFLGLVLFMIFFLLFTKRFSQYLEEITTGITRLSSGDFETRIAVRNDDELTDIAVNLNKMADEVKELLQNERNVENAKNDLITNVAHDLRTPLTSIIGYLDLVARQPLDDITRNKYISIAYNKSKRLEKLIEDLFTYTKLDFGEVRLNCTEVDLVKMMEQMYEEFYPSFEDNGLTCDFISEEKSIVIRADGGLLARAFANLIGNAVKYGADGKNIVIRIEKETDIVITITNFGELIPEEALQNIFEKFYRVENSRSIETGGTGLGLTIAKNIIEMHGGSVCARSDFNGTVFEIRLPMNKE